jgi:hypothetical protein
VKGSIRDYKEFWGLSPNVPFEHCYVNPVSGPFNSVPYERPLLRAHPTGITKIASIGNQLGTFTFILPYNR